MNRSPMPRRSTPLARTTGLTPGTPLRAGGLPGRRAPIKPVSDKRRAENRKRGAMVAAMFPGRPLCVVYELSLLHPRVVPAEVIDRCGRWADDVHEPLTRGRGGSITDPENAVPPCRPCHDVITFRPESELGWAYEAGLLVHSWDARTGDEAA